MASLKHVWVAASALGLATLVACVLAQNGASAGTGAAFLLPDGLREPRRSVVVEFWPQFYTQPGRVSQVQTVGPVGLNQFGQIDAIDTPVTNASNPNSTEIGRGNGFLFFDSQRFPGYENKVTLTFNSNIGLPPNSSINFEGFEPSFTPDYPGPYNYTVAGGTGAFACATGAVTETLFSSTANVTTLHDIANITVGCGFDQANAFYLFFPPVLCRSNDDHVISRC